MIARRLLMASGPNWWDGLDAAWQGKGAASEAESFVDKTGNGNTASRVAGGVITIGADGWEANSSSIISTGLNISSTDSIIVRTFFDGPSGTFETMFGCYDGVERVRGFASISLPASARLDRAGQVIYATTFPYDHVFILNGDGVLYVDGVSAGIVGTNAVAQPFFFLGHNDNGTPTSALKDGAIAAVGIKNSALTAGEIASYTSAIAAL